MVFRQCRGKQTQRKLRSREFRGIIGIRSKFSESIMKELYKIYLKDSKKSFVATGNTTHYDGNKILPQPFALNIVKYDGDSGFYLFYLDESGKEQTDTYHESIEDAFKQAEFEFGVKKEDWKNLN